MRLIIVFTIFFGLLSCKNDLKVDFSDKNLESLYNKKQIGDTLVYYFENSSSKIKSMEIKMGDSIKQIEFDQFENETMKGMIFGGEKVGKWKFYKDGKLKVIKEYFFIKNKEYINRVWDVNEDELYDKSYFFEIYNKDVYSIDEGFKAVAVLNVPMFDENGYIEVKIASDESLSDFNEDFSNENDLILKTYHNLTIDTDNKEWVDLSGGYEYAVAFGRKLNNVGSQVIKGYILEKTNDSLNSKQRKFYFKIPITVIE